MLKKKSTKKAVDNLKKEMDSIKVRGGSSDKKTTVVNVARKIEPRDISDDLIVFEQKLAKIKRAVKKEVKGEALDTLVLKSLMEMVLELIPVAEENYRKYPMHTNASAVNQYVNQAREIMNDVRALEDFSARAEQIVNIVRGQYQLILQNLVDQIQIVREELKTRPDKKASAEILNNLLKAHATFMEESKKAVAENVLKFMVREDK